ncbi:MAG: conjugal transfer protein TraD [Sphingomonas sp.]
MRKPRDFETELKALADKTRLLKERQVRQLGELVIACHADALDIDVLAGALLDAASSSDAAVKEGWRKAGAAFFRTPARSGARGTQGRARSASPDGGGAPSSAGDTGAT